jgi:carbonic anhydrase
MLAKNFKTKICLFVLIQSLFASFAVAAESKVWSFVGRDRPDHWSKLDEKFRSCNDSEKPKIIAVSEADLVKNGDPIIFDYTANNNTAADASKSKHIKIGDKFYKLVEFHLRTPAEHTINGKLAKAVIHFVHQDNDGNIAIVAVMIKEGKYNATIDELIDSYRENSEEKFSFEEGDLMGLLPDSKEYYFQKADMITPPCKNKVNWYIMKEAIESNVKEIVGIDNLVE